MHRCRLIFWCCVVPILVAILAACSVPTDAEQNAARAALEYAHTGTPALHLDGEPTDIRGQCTEDTAPHCDIYLVGRIVNTIPAGAGGSPPEQSVVLAVWLIHVNPTTLAVTGDTTYPSEQAPDVRVLPRVSL